MSKRTLILGANTNEARYGNIATKRLLKFGHEVLPVGIRKGEIDGVPIDNDFKTYEDVDTVTIYLNPTNQVQYYDYILSQKPKRIIFNPGTENPELVALADAQGIESIEACTLVMLATGEFGA
ncbi:MAG TPA: CoA-binding protein [Flavobacteriales bacterium]|nr:CoA-binding protein [Flavobacteriales bacterium]